MKRVRPAPFSNKKLNTHNKSPREICYINAFDFPCEGRVVKGQSFYEVLTLNSPAYSPTGI